MSKKDATGLWNAATSDDNKQYFKWFEGSYNVESSDSKHPTNSANEDYSKKDYLFVIPQNFSENIGTEEHPVDNPDKLYVIVEYDVNYKSGTPSTTITNTVYKKLPIKFEQGKAYMLNLTIGLPIEFDIDVETVSGVEDWNEQPGTNIDSWDDINRK